MVIRKISIIFGLAYILSFCTGCNLLLSILQKDMAEEQKILGQAYGYNPKIKELQIILKDAGYDPGSADGRLGQRTRASIKEFQEDCGLEATGYAGKKTWRELNIAYQDALSLEKADTGLIQKALVNAGFDPGPRDGKWGPKTKQALEEFQWAEGLPVSGEIDLPAWEKLRKYLID